MSDIRTRSSKSIYVGVDVGASRTKVAVIDSYKCLLGYAVEKSGIDFSQNADVCLMTSLKMAKRKRKDIVSTVSTGYGRRNVSYARQTKTEIACHGKGCFYYFPRILTIIDIGGQDNKIIKLNEKGQQRGFKMNRKCAAGTGAFLEEMAMRLDVPLEKMNELARKSEEMVRLGSYCTVFSGTEVLENIRNGKGLPDIVKGIYYSVIKRIMEMDSITNNVVMTGGVVAHNPYLVEMSEDIIKKKILMPEYPQLTGALGAALFAIELGFL